MAGSIRLLKNSTGLWLLQESRRQWQRDGHEYSWGELLALAADATPFRSLVDPDDRAFLNAPDMPAAIRSYCRRTGQPEPESIGATVRCCLESMALASRAVIDSLETLLERRLEDDSHRRRRQPERHALPVHCGMPAAGLWSAARWRPPRWAT
ncbi:MAG: FGGY-family carbohydrate kinase [Caldilineales bacterium]